MEVRLEEVGREIDIRVGKPATGIRSVGFAIGFGDRAVSMAGLGGIGFIYLDHLDSLPFCLLRDHVRKLGNGPGMQAHVKELP